MSWDWAFPHASRRSNRPLAVACVGRPKKRPPAWKRSARISAAASAASVFPTPICASRIQIPAAETSRVQSIIARWTALGANPNRARKTESSIPAQALSQGDVSPSARHARSTRSGYASSSPRSDSGIRGKNATLLAIQSAMISSPVSSTSCGAVRVGSSAAEARPLSARALAWNSSQTPCHCAFWPSP